MESGVNNDVDEDVDVANEEKVKRGNYVFRAELVGYAFHT